MKTTEEIFKEVFFKNWKDEGFEGDPQDAYDGLTKIYPYDVAMMAMEAYADQQLSSFKRELLEKIPAPLIETEAGKRVENVLKPTIKTKEMKKKKKRQKRLTIIAFIILLIIGLGGLFLIVKDWPETAAKATQIRGTSL